MPPPKKRNLLTGITGGAEGNSSMQKGAGGSIPLGDTRYSNKEYRQMEADASRGTKFFGNWRDPSERKPLDIKQPVPISQEEEDAVKPPVPYNYAPTPRKRPTKYGAPK